MNRKPWLIALLILLVLLLSGTVVALAQGPATPAGSSPSAPVGTRFTYQGKLQYDDNPINDTCDMQFTLYDAATGGSQVGPLVQRTGVVVSDGLFIVALDFGSDAFLGESRFMEVAVKCSGDIDYTILDPRQIIAATPYALYALNVAEHEHWGESWSGSGTGLTLSNGDIGLHSTGRDYGVYGETHAIDGTGVHGNAAAITGATSGVVGEAASSEGRGVSGWNTATSGTAIGVQGVSNSTSGIAVFGNAGALGGPNTGVQGQTYSSDGTGVYGFNGASSGSNYGVHGQTFSPSGRGVYGEASATSGLSYGVYGETASTGGRGVYGYASASSGNNYGVYGETHSTSGDGVYGVATSLSGPAYGVHGLSASTSGRGVYGYTTSGSGITYGIYGWAESSSGYGVYGLADASSGTTYGVYGESASTDGYGVYGQGGGYGLYGESPSYSGYGVYGLSTSTTGGGDGVYGQTDGSSGGAGVYGYASNPGGITYGVRGAVESAAGYGVYGGNYGGGYAGWFGGDVHVNGTLSKAGGSFKIDHPLDPANQYLYHSFVESPDMKNVYDGVVVLDESGVAWVTLPDWFEALNGDFRYQLTAIGAPAPDLYIAHKIRDNRFQIAGGPAGLEVSWQVTGIRHDPWAEANRIPVEEGKPAGEQGTYLFPELHGQPEELGIEYRYRPGGPVED